MRISNCLLAMWCFAFVSCAGSWRPFGSRTTTTHEASNSGPDRPATTHEVIVKKAPPHARAEAKTASPGPNYVWMGGNWRWTGTNYVWVSGHWVSRPRPNAVWVGGHWARRAGGWLWIEGHWR